MNLINSFQNIHKTYLGKPYTDCKVTKSTNTYAHFHDNYDDTYKKIDCVQRALMSKIMKECGCFLDYIDNVQNFLPKNHSLKGCDFYSHRYYGIKNFQSVN